MAKEFTVTITVNTVPHPNPERAINLIANRIVDYIIAEEDKERARLLASYFDKREGN